jgi:hypothetical protein
VSTVASHANIPKLSNQVVLLVIESLNTLTAEFKLTPTVDTVCLSTSFEVIAVAVISRVPVFAYICYTIFSPALTIV